MRGFASGQWRLQSLAEVTSTQDIAVAAAQAGEAGRLAVFAASQTSGRGSRGRNWLAPQGNLNLSALLRIPDWRGEHGHLALLAGIALYEALVPFAPNVMLKWPNDVLLDGAKIGGILIDSSVSGAGTFEWAVIGWGANLAVAPEVLDRSTACLPSPAPAPEAVSRSVLAEFDRWADADITCAWLSRAHSIGTELDAVTPAGRVTGRFAGLSSSGGLLLDGISQPLSSGDISLARHAQPLAHTRGATIGQTTSCFSL